MWKKWIDSFLELFFPKSCVACGGRLFESEEELCISCNLKMPRTHYHSYRDNEMEKMMWGRAEIERATAYFHYTKESPYSYILKQLKYGGRKELGEVFGRMMAVEIQSSGFFEDIDYLLPIPLHPKRLKHRGYNQSEWISMGISHVTGIPINTTAVVRKVYIESQTHKTVIERADNVQNIFDCVLPEELEDKHILIIDDVFTTGATVLSCIESICAKTTVRISVLTLAKA